MAKYIVFLSLMFLVPYCNAQQVIPLYSGKIPNAKPISNQEQRIGNPDVDSLTSNVSVPTLSVYLPPKGLANGTSVIICPGGGYHVLLTKREGSDAARAFAKMGVTAFVLKYRLPNDKIMLDKSIGPLQDAQQAIKIVRQRAKEWNIDPKKIGILGFSAGGHLAATAGTHFNKPVIENREGISVRPNFMLLINPVISFTDKIGHIGSRDNLLGPSPTEEKIKLYSNELQVTEETPPTILIHSDADQVVPVANSVEFYRALKENKVSGELHIYAKGEHGFLTAPSFDEWFGRCIFWMKSMSLI
ncbi:alpha/beta hydrolase [Pedobacter panaciterrae]|jgi:Esterase/lipase|uniref:Alpha/beta hydrolase n=1 Tax=Pedobacter panaciterrae TaxID=363849 RepID=A0ABU8NQE5_9SPHI|nr:alpha/beta hydrolase [Pedobacter panaciterrae]NQX52252.1 alpha/beta hydrolase [Pedobacter panaciterrae]